MVSTWAPLSKGVAADSRDAWSHRQCKSNTSCTFLSHTHTHNIKAHSYVSKVRGGQHSPIRKQTVIKYTRIKPCECGISLQASCCAVLTLVVRWHNTCVMAWSEVTHSLDIVIRHEAPWIQGALSLRRIWGWTHTMSKDLTSRCPWSMDAQEEVMMHVLEGTVEGAQLHAVHNGTQFKTYPFEIELLIMEFAI